MSANFEKKIICLITPGHLCNCPRLIKEASSLSALGHEVHIIASAYMPYLFEQDALVQQQHPNWHIHQINWEKGSWNAWKAKIRHHFFKNLAQLFPVKALYPFLLNRNFAWQLAKAKSIKADLYIAHSAASIAVAALAAKNNKVRFGFDAEDFHTGEDLSKTTKQWIVDMEKRYLSKAKYITTASPLIAKAYEKLLLRKDIHPILNVFPKQNLPLESHQHPVLKVFWFSQTIGQARGLEDVLKALDGFKAREVEIHLLGNLRTSDALFFESLTLKHGIEDGIIHYHKSISENELLLFARNFDVGLSLETGAPLNRDLCLNNKLFVYMQAGLATLATATNAQKDFFTAHPDGSILIPLGVPEKIAIAFRWLIAHPEELNKMRKYQDELAKSVYNWEEEQLKFISIVNLCLQERSSS